MFFYHLDSPGCAVNQQIIIASIADKDLPCAFSSFLVAISRKRDGRIVFQDERAFAGFRDADDFRDIPAAQACKKKDSAGQACGLCQFNKIFSRFIADLHAQAGTRLDDLNKLLDAFGFERHGLFLARH
jgi:hypothetical protein